MTREQVKQLLPILQAFAEGKVIQYRDWDMRDNTFEWKDLKKGQEWDWNGSYRIKSQPTYRPFKDVEECWNEMQKHQPFGWLKDIYSGFEPRWRYLVEKLIDDAFFITDGDRYSWSEGFIRYTFADGEPFGVKEEEL